MRQSTRKQKKLSTMAVIGKIAIYFILILWAFTTIFPFLWVTLNSFKDSKLVYTDSFSLPNAVTFTWKNYVTAFERLDILNAYKNSIVISGSVTIGVMILSSMLSFALTRYNFKGKKILDSAIVASLMIPVFSTIIPVMKMMVQGHLLNTPIAVILPQIAGNLSFATIVMMGFLRGLPLEMEEAAYMEGANVLQVFTKIIVPLCKASLSTVAIFSFLWSYNDLFVQSVMIRDQKGYPIGKLLNEISSKYGTDYGLMASSVTIILVPVLIIYILLQKNIIKGLTAGAVKG